MAENSCGLICRTCGKRFIGGVGYKRHLAICGINLTGDPIEWNFVSVVRKEPTSEHQQPKEESGTMETEREDLYSHNDRKYTIKTELTDVQKQSSNELFECAECSRQFFHKRSLSMHISKVHNIKSSKSKCVKTKSMVCKICAAKYKMKKAFLRHLKNCKEQNPPIFKCSKCQKQFGDRPHLVRHENTVHLNGDNMFQCSMCKKSFNRLDNFKRHLKSCKNRLKIDSFICYYCGNEFSRKSSIKLHILRQHWIQSAVKCEICGVKFKGVSSEFALKRHIKEYHIDNNLTGKLKCSFCFRAFFSRENILCHLVEEHDITFSHTHLSFASMQQFQEWKTNLEKTSLSFFRNRRGFTHTKNYSMSIYECHRSGSYQPKTDGRKRRVKLQGTKKIGCYCPAEISLCVRKSDGTCRVSFSNTHLGHRVGDENELAYLSVPRDERAQLASKICSGLSYDQILKEHTLAETDRRYLLTRKDLHNISRAFNVKEKVASCEDVDIDSFVEQHRKSIVFANLGDSSASNDEIANDFFVIVMTLKQKEVLRKFGSKVIALDATFGCSCDFLLLTLLVVDDYHEAVPVAFGISARKDFAAVDVFVARIRQEVGVVRAQLFMSDVRYDYCASWRETMGAAENRPFCKWYVPETWRRKLKRISDPTKRAQTRNRFYQMLTQLDENLFRSTLREFFADPDPDLEDTLRTMRGHLDEIEKWSNCWRENALANTNMHVESLNRKLRYLYGKVAAAKTLTALLSVVDGYLNLNECELKRKEIKGVVSYKLCDLRRRHDQCLDDVVSVERTADGWYVSVTDAQSEVADVHFVCECHDSCSGCKLYCEKCQTCAQQYRCTCADNAVKSNMCKHIHALCMRLNRDDERASKGCADLTNLLHSSAKKVVSTDNGFCNFHTCDSNQLIDVLPTLPADFEIENIETSDTVEM